MSSDELRSTSVQSSVTPICYTCMVLSTMSRYAKMRQKILSRREITAVPSVKHVFHSLRIFQRKASETQSSDCNTYAIKNVCISSEVKHYYDVYISRTFHKSKEGNYLIVVVIKIISRKMYL